jgi:hypothetical protein
MAGPIKIEAVRLEGFRAYLQSQTFPLWRGKTPLSLAVFAPNAKGKSGLVDGFEFYFSDNATLERLGNRKGVVPSGYLSDSQIHALALSLRFAAIRMFNTQVTDPNMAP